MVTIKPIYNQDKAFQRLGDHLRKIYGMAVVAAEFNGGRHRLYECNGEKIYAVYKREWFNTFSKQFEDVPIIKSNEEYRGVGESLNVEFVELACKYNAVLIFVHPDGFYKVFSNLYRKFAEKHGLYRVQERFNKFKRTGGGFEMRKEVTYCVPFSLLERLEV
jgi:hypothetical protein